MKENYQRLQEEVTWFTDKFDYRNKDKDWGNSKDSIQRCMQKLGGGYPGGRAVYGRIIILVYKRSIKFRCRSFIRD